MSRDELVRFRGQKVKGQGHKKKQIWLKTGTLGILKVMRLNATVTDLSGEGIPAIFAVDDHLDIIVFVY